MIQRLAQDYFLECRIEGSPNAPDSNAIPVSEWLTQAYARLACMCCQNDLR